jgi:hypothetical protein
VTSYAVTTLGLGLGALVPGGRAWTVPALAGAAFLAGAGCSIAQLVLATVLAGIGTRQARLSAVSRMEAWALCAYTVATLGVGAPG